MSAPSGGPTHVTVRVRTAAPLALLSTAIEVDAASARGLTPGDDSTNRCFDLLFGDGARLRDLLVLTFDDGHPALRSWDVFVSSLLRSEDDWYRDLLDRVFAACGTERGFASVVPTAKRNGRIEIETALQLLDVSQPDDQLQAAIGELLQYPGRSLRRLISDFFSTIESEQKHEIERQIEDAASRLAGRGIPPDPSGAYLMLTGLDVPATDRDRLDECQEVHFVLSPGVGERAQIRYIGTRAVIPFEPCEYPEKLAMPVDIYEALGNEMRMRIILLLARRGELYGAELVELIGAPQATVSNHLTKLEAVGMVRRRPHGRRTYYRLVPATLDRAAERLTQLRLTVHDPLQRELPIG